jgi:hypothetical protein
MLKFLRKYNKFILVVGGVLLMIVFVAPQAIQQLGPNPQNQVQFRVGGKAYKGKDVLEARQEIRALQVVQSMTPVPFLPFQSVEHWILLTMEAERMGMVGGPDDAIGLFELVADQAASTAQPMFGANSNPEQLRAQRRAEALAALQAGRDEAINEGLPARFVDESLAKLRGVYRLANTLGGFSEISTQEAAYFGRDLYDTAIVDLGLIYARDLPAGDVPEPTDAELREQFERYQDSTGEDNAFGFGYRLPEAVRLETLEIDTSTIRQAITLDPVEVNTHWRRNKERFGDSFTSARAFVESDMRRSKLDELMRGVKETVRRELIRSRLELERDGAFLVLPEDWASRRPSFERLAEVAQAEIDDRLGAPTPAVTVSDYGGRWMARDEVASLQTLARAAVTTAVGSLQFPSFVFSVRELAPESGVNLQAGVAYGPIDSATRSVYARVLDTRRAGPPESMEAVAAAVREDLLTLRRYEGLVDRRDAIRSRVAEGGTMSVLYDDYEELLAQVGLRVTREGSQAAEGPATPVRADVPEVRDAVMDTAGAWDPLASVESVPVDERALAIEIPGERALAVAIIQGRLPMTREQLRSGDARLMFEAGDAYGAGTSFTFSDGALSPDALKARLGFESALPEDEEDEAADAPEAPAEG